MSKEIKQQFQKLFLDLPRETQKALNDWCQEANGSNLPKWFGDASDNDKILLVEAIKSGDLSAYGIDKQVIATSTTVEAEPVQTEHKALIGEGDDEDEESHLSATPDVFGRKLSEDELKHLLEANGYKPEVERASRDVDVTLSVTIRVPASLKTDEDVTAYLEEATKDIEFTVGDSIYSPSFTEWDDAKQDA